MCLLIKKILKKSNKQVFNWANLLPNQVMLSKTKHTLCLDEKKKRKFKN